MHPAPTERHESTITEMDWTSVDWARPVDDIASEAGCSRSTVFLRRDIFVPDRPKARCGRRRVEDALGIDVNAIDWSLSNSEIARKFGIAPATATRLRRSHEGRQKVPAKPEKPGDNGPMDEVFKQHPLPWTREHDSEDDTFFISDSRGGRVSCLQFFGSMTVDHAIAGEIVRHFNTLATQP